MDPLHPTGPSNPQPQSAGGPGNGAPPGARFDPADTQPVGPADGSAPVAPVPPPSATEAVQQVRAIFRDGQRLLYYSVHFAQFLVPNRVYGHGRIYEGLLALTLIRLHAGLERLILTQMPLARGNTSPPGQSGDVDWRDLTLFLQTWRIILPSDALFLNDVAHLRNQLVHGEIVALERDVVIHLAELGDAIFAKLDPGYQRPELDAQKDALPPRPAPAVAPPLPPVAVPTQPAGWASAPPPRPAAAPAGQGDSWMHPGPTAEQMAAGAQMPAASPTSQGDTWLHPGPTGEHMAAGAQRSRVPQGPNLYCPHCGREVAPGDLWCPRCEESFVAPGALQPQPEPPGAEHAPRRPRGLFGRFMGR